MGLDNFEALCSLIRELLWFRNFVAAPPHVMDWREQLVPYFNYSVVKTVHD